MVGNQRCIMRANPSFCRSCTETMNTTGSSRSRVASILTDMHFWVPVVVLVAGLLLLRFIH